MKLRINLRTVSTYKRNRIFTISLGATIHSSNYSGPFMMSQLEWRIKTEGTYATRDDKAGK
jgi:hypothetical protein